MHRMHYIKTSFFGVILIFTSDRLLQICSNFWKLLFSLFFRAWWWVTTILPSGFFLVHIPLTISCELLDSLLKRCLEISILKYKNCLIIRVEVWNMFSYLRYKIHKFLIAKSKKIKDYSTFLIWADFCNDWSTGLFLPYNHCI